MYFLCDVLDSCFGQNYPGNEVLSALTQHPAMSDGLFQQLFDTQCKVGCQKLNQFKLLPASSQDYVFNFWVILENNKQWVENL